MSSAAVSAPDSSTILARQRKIESILRILESPAESPDAKQHARDELAWHATEIREHVQPQGYKLLVYVPYLLRLMDNGLVRPDENRDVMQTASLKGYVIAIGPLAYKDKERFPDGPWCKEGDFIMMRAYSGTRFSLAGYPFEYRLINDDTVEATLQAGLEIERPS